MTTQTYPATPIPLIVPFSMGAPNEIIVRAAADELGKRLGENVVAVPGFDIASRNGIAAPAGNSAPVVKRLNDEVNRALNSPAISRSLSAIERRAAWPLACGHGAARPHRVQQVEEDRR